MKAAESNDQAAKNCFLVSKALADLRQGHPHEALDILHGETLTVLQPMPQLILAMAQQQLGQPDNARKTLAAALGVFDWSRNRAIDPDAWMLHILRRQAEQMIEPTPSSRP